MEMRALLDAERRGILPADKQGALTEARRRGLVPLPVPKTGGPVGGSGSAQFTPTPEDPSRSVAELTSGFVSRPSFEAAGGMTGAAIGAAGGIPTGPGTLVTSAAAAGLGTMFGGLAYETVDDVVRWFQGGGPYVYGRDDEWGPVKRAAGEGLLDAEITLAAPFLGPVWRAVKGMKQGFFGVRGNEQVVKMAKDMGIPITGIQATDARFIKGLSRVLGMFPWVGTPFHKLEARTASMISTSYNDLLNTLAPHSIMGDSAAALTQQAGKEFQSFRGAAAELYQKFDALADKASVREIVPTEDIVDVAQKAIGKRGTGTITLKNQKVLGVARQGDPLEELLSDLTQLPDRLTVHQFRGFQRRLKDEMGAAIQRGDSIEELSALKEALDASLNKIDVSLLPADEGADIAAALMTANEFYAVGIKRFQTATAKGFGSYDARIFGPGAFKAKTKEADEMFKKVFRVKSPKSLTHLRELVGTDAFNGAVRTYLDDAFNSSFVVTRADDTVFDAKRFESLIGLNTKAGVKALEEMFRGTGVKVSELQNFITVAKKAMSFVVPDMSAFLQRRMAIAGFSGVLGGIALAAGSGAPIITIGAIGLLARATSSILTNPNRLKKLMTAVDDSLPEQQRRSALLRLAAEILDKEPEPQGPMAARYRRVTESPTAPPQQAPPAGLLQ